MPDDLARDVVREFEQLDGDMGVWKSHWQQVANYMVPDRADYMVERSPGQKRMQWIYDSLPILVIEQLAAGLHARLTSSTLPWFVLAAANERLNRIDRVRQWLQLSSAHIYSLFADPLRNFPTHSHELYLDLASIGTGVMAITEARQGGPRFSTRHMKECRLIEGDDDRIDGIARSWEWTAKKAYQRWGVRAGEKVLEAYGKGDGSEHKKFRFHHRVKPRLNRDPQRADRLHKPFESVYVSEADLTVIDAGGFDDFPYIAPRLAKVPGETYGRGRGMVMLPDVKMLMELNKLIVKSAQKVVDPPLQIPDQGFLVPIRTTPGSFNYYRGGTRPTDRIAPIDTHGQVQIGLDILQALREQIKEEAYINLMMTPTDQDRPGSEGKGVTATFVARKSNQDMQMLSPVLSRLSCEQNQPLVDRVFNMEWRRSMAMRFGPGSPFPPPPPELRGADLRVVYLNPIALAQRATELSAVDQLVARQLSLKQLDPETPTVIDAEAIMRLEGRDLNSPVEVLKTPDRLAAEAQQRAKMIQRQHEAELAANVAGAAKDGTGAAQNFVAMARHAQDMRAAA